VVNYTLNEQQITATNMKRIFLISPAILLASALPGAALEFGNGFTATGEFLLQYTDSSSGSGDTFGYGTADIAFDPSGGGFGGFVGFDAVNGSGTNEIAGYAALSFSGSFGKVQIGAPRAAIDDYIDTPPLAGLLFFEIGSFASDRSALTSAYLLSDADTPIGIRYDGNFGDLKFGTSLHRLDTTDVFNLAANYQIGTVVVRGALEYASDSGLQETSYYLGAENTFGPVLAGVLYSDLAIVGDFRTLQLYATYSPIEKLDLTGSVWIADDSSSTSTLYGISAEYGFAQGAYVQGGIADGKDTSSSYDLSLGVKF
jgi:Gram-negative porin